MEFIKVLPPRLLEETYCKVNKHLNGPKAQHLNGPNHYYIGTTVGTYNRRVDSVIESSLRSKIMH